MLNIYNQVQLAQFSTGLCHTRKMTTPQYQKPPKKKNQKHEAITAIIFHLFPHTTKNILCKHLLQMLKVLENDSSKK